MKPHVFERVIAEVAKHIPPIRSAVLYHGGEPLMNKRFYEMPRALKAIGIPFVKTVSNGMLFKAGTAERIVESGLDLIEFSLRRQSAGESDGIRLRSRARDRA